VSEAPDVMSSEEERRYYQGRRDWREQRWQDHCGDEDCERCTGYIEVNQRVADLRRSIFILPHPTDDR
jgi:hypothetical protein